MSTQKAPKNAGLLTALDGLLSLAVLALAGYYIEYFYTVIEKGNASGKWGLVALMFLGCEGTKPDKTTMEFIRSLNNKRVENAALFCCNPKKSDAAISVMRDALKAQGINVLDKSFVCTGKGFLSGKAPTDQDLDAARKFAAECVKVVMPNN